MSAEGLVCFHVTVGITSDSARNDFLAMCGELLDDHHLIIEDSASVEGAAAKLFAFSLGAAAPDSNAESSFLYRLASFAGLSLNYLTKCWSVTPANPLPGPDDVVVVESWPVLAASRRSFREACRKRARVSASREGGCSSFLILESIDSPADFFLVQSFRDVEAFRAHRETPHFEAFAEVARRLSRRDDSGLVIKGGLVRSRPEQGNRLNGTGQSLET